MCVCGTGGASAQHKWHRMAQLLWKGGVGRSGLGAEGLSLKAVPVQRVGSLYSGIPQLQHTPLVMHKHCQNAKISPAMHTALKSQERPLKSKSRNTFHRPINWRQVAKLNWVELFDSGKKMGVRNGCLLNSHSLLIYVISDPKIAKGP